MYLNLHPIIHHSYFNSLPYNFCLIKTRQKTLLRFVCLSRFLLMCSTCPAPLPTSYEISHSCKFQRFFMYLNSLTILLSNYQIPPVASLIGILREWGRKEGGRGSVERLLYAFIIKVSKHTRKSTLHKNKSKQFYSKK